MLIEQPSRMQTAEKYSPQIFKRKNVKLINAQVQLYSSLINHTPNVFNIHYIKTHVYKTLPSNYTIAHNHAIRNAVKIPQ